MSKRLRALCAALFWLVIMAPMSSTAQPAGACIRGEIDDPPRVVFRCANGLVLEAEAAAALDIGTIGAEGRPEAVGLVRNGLLIEVEPGSGPFQIRTPHAIAAVRGTVYVVDVRDDMTSVFVTRGEVFVSRPDGSETVSLTEGLGVEVTDGQPIEVRRWPEEKAAELLARFAR